MRPLLVIGNKNYSSWSLRPWLALRKAGVDFEELRLPLDTPEFSARIGEYSPTGRVPLLRDGALHVWESLAICEYVNERWGEGRLLPADPGTRAWARALMSEMHAGFTALRAAMPMNCRAEGRRLDIDQNVRKDIERVCTLWEQCLAHADGGDWLFGDWSLVDAMYAPVALRFTNYRVKLTPAAERYVATTLADPDVAEWIEAGRLEPEVVEADEAGI